MILASGAQSRSAGCPDHALLRDFLFGKLSLEASTAIARHIDDCQACAAVLATLDESADPVVAALRGPAAGEPFSEADSQRVIDSVARLVDKPNPIVAASGLSACYMPGASLERVGDYELLSRLGEGGMGAVFRARHRHLDKIVALKLISPERIGGVGAVARFQREMRAIGRLEHPNIVAARDAGEADGVWYLVMEYVDGVDLSALARCVGPMAVPDACELMRQAACGLQHAYEHGLVHRDIKPSNVMLSPTGQVKLLDLGLALLHVEQSPDELTGPSVAMGTADYMAPEQADNSRDVDIRADLYSLGCTLYRLLTGRVPFAGPAYDTLLKKVWAHAHAATPQLRDMRPDVSASLETVIARLMAKDPALRYQTPAEVAEALMPFTSGHDLSRLSASAPQSECPPADHPSRSQSTNRGGATLLPARRAERPASPKIWVKTAVAAGLLVFLTAMAMLMIHRAGNEQSAPGNPDAMTENSPRRRTAEFVLRVGGSLTLLKDGQTLDVDKLDELPPMPFSVVQVALAHNEQFKDSDVARIGDLCRLQSLDLDHTALADSGLERLQKLTILSNLNISGTQITDAGLARLADKTRLRRLSLATTMITDAGLAHLAGLKQLEVLDLGETQITDDAMEQLGQLTALVELCLYGTKITDRGLLQLRGRKNLRLLFVNDTQVGDAGARHIATLRNLTTLGLRHTQLTDAGLEQLQSLSNLLDLDVSDTHVTAAGVRKFRLALPQCQISSRDSD